MSRTSPQKRGPSTDGLTEGSVQAVGRSNLKALISDYLPHTLNINLLLAIFFILLYLVLLSFKINFNCLAPSIIIYILLIYTVYNEIDAYISK